MEKWPECDYYKQNIFNEYFFRKLATLDAIVFDKQWILKCTQNIDRRHVISIYQICSASGVRQDISILAYWRQETTDGDSHLRRANGPFPPNITPSFRFHIHETNTK
jgi:hypothetical protein